MKSNRPLLGSELMSHLERANALLEKANREIDAQAFSPGDVKARLKCYDDIQRLVNDGIDSILRAHPELSTRRVPR